MSDIPSALNKIQIEGVQTRFPVSEDLLQTMGGSVNYLIDAFTNGLIKKTDFTSSGSFTTPADVSLVYVEGCGGGGGGGHNLTSDTYGGGSGAVFKNGIYPVTPSSVISVTIGAGGSGNNSGIGGSGGNSSFGSISNFPGGGGGGVNTFGSGYNGFGIDAYSYAIGGTYSGGSAAYTGFAIGQRGFIAGRNGGYSGSTYDGVGGGAGPYGDGGDAGSNTDPSASAYGAGGNFVFGPGAKNGISGFIRIVYFSRF